MLLSAENLRLSYCFFIMYVLLPRFLFVPMSSYLVFVVVVFSLFGHISGLHVFFLLSILRYVFFCLVFSSFQCQMFVLSLHIIL